MRVLLCLVAAALATVPAQAEKKEKPDPTNRIFLVGDRGEWVDTGLWVRPQDLLNLRAGSEVCFSGDDLDSCVRAEGWPRESYEERWSGDAAACEDPFPEWNHAALVAKVGDEPILVGKKTEIENLEGPLLLTVNDCSFEGAHGNDGQFSVVVVIENPVALAARRGRQAIEAAIEALGGEKAIRRVQSLRAHAQCTGPGGEFTTEVLSRLPEQVLFRQSSEQGSMELLMVGDKAWSIDRELGTRKDLSKKMREFIRGHEFHYMLFELATRFEEHTLPLAAEGDEPSPESATDQALDPVAWPPTECELVEMRDLLGAPAAVCLDPETSMPLHLRYQPAGDKKAPPILVELEDWREIDEVQFLEAFTLRHGEEVFTYRYDEIEPNSVERQAFKDVSERALKEIRKKNKRGGDPEVPAAPEEAESEG
jgi:hypothetical protein